MDRVTCPSCSAGLSPREVSDGWCEQCGKKVPAYLLFSETGKPLPGTASSPLAQPQRKFQTVADSGAVYQVKWGVVALTVFLVLAGLAMFYMAFTGAEVGTSRRGRALEGLLGKSGTWLLLGCVALGWAAYMLRWCRERK